MDADKDRKFTIIVGQDDYVLHEDHVEYDKIVQIWLKDGGQAYNQYLIKYSEGPKENPKGTLAPGETVKVKDGMHFRISGTGES